MPSFPSLAAARAAIIPVCNTRSSSNISLYLASSSDCFSSGKWTFFSAYRRLHSLLADFSSSLRKSSAFSYRGLTASCQFLISRWLIPLVRGYTARIPLPASEACSNSGCTICSFPKFLETLPKKRYDSPCLKTFFRYLALKNITSMEPVSSLTRSRSSCFPPRLYPSGTIMVTRASTAPVISSASCPILSLFLLSS